MANYPSFLLERVVLHKLKMRLKNPFITSFGTVHDKEFYIVEIIDEDGNRGFGETVAFRAPWYTEETVKTNEHIMCDFLIPLLFQNPITHPDEITERFSLIKRNNMAKAALEEAVWDLFAKRKNISLSNLLGGEKNEIDVGISIGIQKTTSELIKKIDASLREGYKRIKIKIKPGYDVSILKEIRRHFPDIPLMVDANCAYTLNDVDQLKRLDEFQLLMIEQPFSHNDFLDHAILQEKIETPICLDESIHSLEDARVAIQLGSCKIINIKVGRVGGLTEAKKIHDYCLQHQIPVWCGGMLESGIGRAHNISISTLKQFTLPGDTSGSNRYWEKDIIEPEVIVKNGVISIKDTPGIGYDINRKVLQSYCEGTKTFSRKHDY